jgi:hypothetical protein
MRDARAAAAMPVCVRARACVSACVRACVHVSPHGVCARVSKQTESTLQTDVAQATRHTKGTFFMMAFRSSSSAHGQCTAG